MLETFIYLLLSGFLIWFIQTQKIFDKLFFIDFLKEMRKCGLCLGFWVCLLLQPIFKLGILDNFNINIYTYIVNVLVTAAVSSFIIFLVVKGYEHIYGVTRL